MRSDGRGTVRKDWKIDADNPIVFTWVTRITSRHALKNVMARMRKQCKRSAYVRPSTDKHV